jgi:hypothetical protein
MTMNEALAKARAAVDEVLESKLRDYAEWLTEHGATEQELTAEMTRQQHELYAERDAGMVKLRAWLEREGETLQ